MQLRVVIIATDQPPEVKDGILRVRLIGVLCSITHAEDGSAQDPQVDEEMHSQPFPTGEADPCGSHPLTLIIRDYLYCLSALHAGTRIRGPQVYNIVSELYSEALHQ